jgi:predicted DsbA family dithiol-disulfide isomerase
VSSASHAHKIDLWIDVVCPWCRLNHSRLAKARAELAAEGVHSDVVYRPFQLAPRQPAGVTRTEHFTRAFGDMATADAAFEHVRQVGAAEGVTFRFDRITLEPNTLQAHRLLRHAQELGSADQAAEAVYDAFFVRGEDIGDIDFLVSIGARAGLDPEPLAGYLSSGHDTQNVQQQADLARELGVRGVPTYGVNGRPAAFAPDGQSLRPALLELLRSPAGALR